MTGKPTNNKANRKTTRHWLALLSLGCVAIYPHLAASAEPQQRLQLALVVGVQQYPELSEREQLAGCRNDVQLVRTMLRERFEFPQQNITTLVDAEATGRNIRGRLEEIVKQVRAQPPGSPKAQVVFHFSGHGSQIPDQAEGSPDADEEDGLDETLVPYDATRQGGDEDIRDDELYEYARRITEDERAEMWIVLDSCHSGTGARGTAKFRQLVRSVTAAPARDGKARKITPRKLPPGVVFLSACRDEQREPEYKEGGQTYGLLTRFMVQVLNEQPKLSTMSYDLLRQTVLDRYRRHAGVSPLPEPDLEAAPQKRRQTILALGKELDRPAYWQVRAIADDRGRVRLLAGSFHGVTSGSFFELYERPEDIEWKAENAGKGSLAWLRVENVAGDRATCQVIAWEDAKRADWYAARISSSFQQGYAVERYHEHGDFTLRVQVVRAEDAQTDGPPLSADDPALPAAVKEALTAAKREGESPWLRWTTDSDCDVLLRIDGAQAALFPATGMPQVYRRAIERTGRVPESLVGGWGPIDLTSAGAAKTLQDYLRRIARARNLIRLTSVQSVGEGTIPLDVRLMKLNVVVTGGRPQLAGEPVPWPADQDGAICVDDGSFYDIQVTNRAKDGPPVHVTVLQVTADMGIDQVLPYQDSASGRVRGDQQLAAGQTKSCGGFRLDKNYGPRWTVVLATREPNDYYMLAQDSLPQARDIGKKSSLEELLMQQTYFNAHTRGRPRPPRRRPRQLHDASWGAVLLRWQALPGATD